MLSLNLNLLYFLFCLFSPFLWETTKMNHKGWHVDTPHNNRPIWKLEKTLVANAHSNKPGHKNPVMPI